MSLIGLNNLSPGVVSATGTIVDNDITPDIAIFDLSVNEGLTAIALVSLSLALQQQSVSTIRAMTSQPQLPLTTLALAEPSISLLGLPLSISCYQP